ncbi:hypothetical protein EV421DRAFT_1910919 [Armillaria borealis]|uniref:F-box domain-containing protein n=1 Tax=Armillaria borealis TaxID=47425 RepID=A0AA39MGA4_9AGAR|nr:hypothetical protein EV421DRAFT_1910919 [Armillaria borealis]
MPSAFYTSCICHLLSAIKLCRFTQSHDGPHIHETLCCIFLPTHFTRPFRLLDLPIDVLDIVLGLMDHEELLVLRGLSRLLAGVSTQRTHRHICLHLPEEWMLGWFREHAGISITFEEEYLTTSEVALFCFIVRWGLMDVVFSISFDNWPELWVCFFFHLLTALQEVRIISINSLFHSYTDIRYLYMLPSSVTSVLLRGCTFVSHSLELMLSSCQHLQCLSLQSVYDGHIVLPEVTLGEVEEWGRCHFAGLKHVLLSSIPSPSLRRLDINLNSGGLRDAVDCLPHRHRSSHLLDQMLSMPDWVDKVQEVFGSSVVFPVALRCSALECLDLVVGGSLSTVPNSMWACMDGSLRQLSVHYDLDGLDHDDTSLRMGALTKLEVLQLTCVLETLPRALNTLQTCAEVIRADIYICSSSPANSCIVSNHASTTIIPLIWVAFRLS